MEHCVRRLVWQHRTTVTVVAECNVPANVEHCWDGYLVRFISRCT